MTRLCWPLQLPPTPKSVLIAMADCVNGDDNFCWPSIPTLATMTCFSERAIQNAIKLLEDCKIVVADRSNGRHTKYFLHPENFDPSHINSAPTPARAAPVPPQEVHGYPRISCAGTPAGDAPLPPQEMRQPPQEMRQPPQEVPSNRKEPERTGKSLKTKAQKNPLPEIELPDWIPEKAWSDYLDMRIEKKKVPTVKAIALLFAKLSDMRDAGQDLKAVLDNSTMNGWTGIFPVKAEQHRRPALDLDEANRLANAEAKQMLFGNQGDFIDA